MFQNSIGKPIGIQRIVSDVIRPALKSSGTEWHGWHALRRGLSTNLHELAVPDKIIQVILRHANVGVTQLCYVKTRNPQAVEEMKKLERKISHATNRQPEQKLSSISVWVEFERNAQAARFQQLEESGGEGGIRTPGTAFDRTTV